MSCSRKNLPEAVYTTPYTWSLITEDHTHKTHRELLYPESFSLFRGSKIARTSL